MNDTGYSLGSDLAGLFVWGIILAGWAAPFWLPLVAFAAGLLLG